MSDLIERDKAINILEDMGVEIIPSFVARRYVRIAIDEIRRRLKDIPSARPKGEWIERIGGISKELFYQCSKCYGEVDTDEFDYCPWCGADMREREGE